MKLDFVKMGNLICPTDADGQLVEDVLKCTVTSSPEQETVMTLTVTVAATPILEPHTDQITWECAVTGECVTGRPVKDRCTHVGSKPRLCVDDRGLPMKWRPKT